MKKIIILLMLLFSTYTMACSKHQLNFSIGNKSFLKTDSFKLIDLVKDQNQKWTMEIELSKKIVKKLSDITKKNVGKNLDLLFDKQLIASFPIASELSPVHGNLSVLTNFDDQKALELKNECQHH